MTLLLGISKGRVRHGLLRIYPTGPIGVPEELQKDLEVDRRTALGGILGVAALAVAGGGAAKADAAATKLKLAFCGQLLCVIPYEVTRARGHFADQGLDVQLVYTRGGNAAMQALVGGSVDYAGTSFDVALQAFAKGAKIRRFASTAGFRSLRWRGIT